MKIVQETKELAEETQMIAETAKMRVEVEYESNKYLCSSLRIDNVVSSITNLSRSSVDELFKDDNVLLNYEIVKKFRVIEEGDILSIRRFGKYKFII